MQLSEQLRPSFPNLCMKVAMQTKKPTSSPLLFPSPSTLWSTPSRSTPFHQNHHSFRAGILTKPSLHRSRFYSRHHPFDLRAVPSRNKTETPEASILPNGHKSRQPTRLVVEGPKGLRIGLYYCFLPRGISISQFAPSSHSIHLHLHHLPASSSTSTSSQILL